MASKKRLLTIDEPLRDDRVENASFGSGQTLLEYGIVLWNPTNILSGYQLDYPGDYRGRPSLDDRSSFQFARDLERRRRELGHFLEFGRTLVILLPSPTEWWIATGEKKNIGTAAKPRTQRIVTDVSTDDVLPEGVALEPGNGKEFELVAGPPFSAFWGKFGERFYYSAHLSETFGSPLLKIPGTELVVGAMGKSGDGIILLLPQLYDYAPDFEDVEGESEDEAYERYEKAKDALDQEMHGELVDGLLELVGELRGDEDELPAWAGRLVLPGEQEAQEAVERANDAVAKAQRNLEDSQAALLAAQRFKGLVTATGKALERVVEEAFVELGATIEEGGENRVDRIIKWKRQAAVAEVKGLGKSAGERDAAQLEKWVSEHTQAHGKTPKAILVVNAWRGDPLPERDKPAFPDQMLGYSKQREHALVTTSQLLAAVSLPTKKAKAEFLDKLFGTVGVLEGYEWQEGVALVEETAGEGNAPE
jgi:hypothetical protein